MDQDTQLERLGKYYPDEPMNAKLVLVTCKALLVHFSRKCSPLRL